MRVVKMLSPREKEYLQFPENFTEAYQKVLKSKIRTKIRKLYTDLHIITVSLVKFPKFTQSTPYGQLLHHLTTLF